MGNEGELYVRGATVFNGYLDEPDLTAACLTADGWFKTGWWFLFRFLHCLQDLRIISYDQL